MIGKENKSTILDLKFWLICVSGYSAGYLMFKDRILSLNSIWNLDLLLLAGPIIFGIAYKLEFLVISFWLLFGLTAMDVIVGIHPGMAGVSYWGGLAVCFLTVPAGLVGCAISSLVPKGNKSIKSKIVRL